jgi:hypothetical protein
MRKVAYEQKHSAWQLEHIKNYLSDLSNCKNCKKENKFWLFRPQEIE